MEGCRPGQWRVIWQRDPATTATLAWSTRLPGQRHILKIRPRGSEVPSQAQEFVADSGAYSYARKNGPSLFHHRVELTQLAPAQPTRSSLKVMGKLSPTLYFITAPADDQPFSLLCGGDSRTGIESRRAINRMIAQLVMEGAASADPADRILAFVHAGDYVERGMDLDQWSTWLSDHEFTVTEDGQLLPIIPARGNHDRGRLYCEAFGFDVLDNHNWFAMSIGSLLRLITLNTEASIAGEQAKWLADELQAARNNHGWLVVQYHRPAYAAVKWPSGALLHWVPLFEQFNVDLVCEGDGHNIKRTMPIRGGQPDPTGSRLYWRRRAGRAAAESEAAEVVSSSPRCGRPGAPCPSA